MTRTCPSCEQPTTGRFCSHCGAAVQAECRECGSPLPPGARFCNHCGAAAAPAGGTAGADETRAAGIRGNPVPWAVAGGAVLALAVVLFLWLGRRDASPVQPAASGAPLAAAPAGGTGGMAGTGPGAPSAGAAGVDLSSMTPREAADRLFNRVMQSVSNGDSAQARSFLPMAIAAYGRVGQLDTDGRYHLAVLHLVNGDPQAARTEAGAILAVEPEHLFGLFTAAQAETQMGNTARARELYERFLSAYESQGSRDLPEYRDHRQALGPMREEAERVLAVSGR